MTLIKTKQNFPAIKESRRNFLKYLLGLGAAGFGIITIYPIISFLKPPKQREIEVSSVSAGPADSFKTGDFKIIRFGKGPVIVIKDEENNFKAFSATCTHLDCTVQYIKEEKIIWCACHNGKYDLQGRNISGPPPRPLEKYIVMLKDKELIVTKKS